jgi:ubiquinone/menaquinone biosynthesis C-methylase UbiE
MHRQRYPSARRDRRGKLNRPTVARTQGECVLSNPLLPSEMFEHYRQVKESTRLLDGVGELERDRTQDILKRHLIGAPATVFDIGGAAGVHALWLARCGYTVHLFDPVRHHVEQALTASRDQAEHPIASCSVADARDIDRPDNSADAVLLLGPLYHLIHREDRLKALKEAHRLLKPGGRVFVATISRFASLIDGLSRDLVSDPAFLGILMQDLEDGQHRNPTNSPDYFTTSYFHHPGELKQEMEDAGFYLEKLLGVEGPVWFMSSLSNHWRVPEKRALILELLRMVEQDRYILGVSAHPMGIGRK